MGEPTQEYQYTPLKKLALPSLAHFKVAPDEKIKAEYEHYVNLTSKLIGRSYIATAKLVEKWSLDLIKRRYHDASKDNNPAMRWWVLRKFNR